MTASTEVAASRAQTPAVRLLRCHDCALLQRVRRIPTGSRAVCTRCGTVLLAPKRHGLERGLALYLSALILWCIANGLPFLTLEMEGRRQPSILASGAVDLYRDGLWELAILVFLVVIAFPLLKVLAGLGVLLPLHLGRRTRGAAPLFRLVGVLRPWAMTEVFLLGVLVAYAKLVDLATIDIGPALLAFVGLIMVLVGADAALDEDEMWERIRHSPEPPPPPALGRTQLVDCHTCRRVCRLPPLAPGEVVRCPRCGARLHSRRPDSLSRCWALVAAAVILYVPANLYPVMTIISFGSGEPNTILGGVKELLEAGMWPLALLVFFASITVPMLKLVGLLYLLVSVHRHSRWRPRERTVLYRLVEAVGRWSMIDIFMLSILVALVRMGGIATIEPGPGALAFAAVVVLTMFAAMVFDPRLLWDAAGANRER